MTSFYCLVVGLIFISYLDIRYRRVNNKYLAVVLMFIGLVLWREQHFPYNVAIIVCVLVVGVLLSNLRILGAADSKLIAILLLAIPPKLIVLLVFFTAVGVLISCIVFYAAVWCDRVERAKGIPLVPAISAAGLFCVWISLINGLVL
ncbi:prepilin peptidase [Celerinatantimonas yamalensis]|uniref:Prepilin peptidase n=1 Tax=Celerinatantimonas yamalensis TaxID=559956 RepID=A0ABW9G271_9GAMM